jgi:hypothetical protein
MATPTALSCLLGCANGPAMTAADGSPRVDGPSLAQVATETCTGGAAVHAYPGKSADELLGVTAYFVADPPIQRAGVTVTREILLELWVGDGNVVATCATGDGGQVVFWSPG